MKNLKHLVERALNEYITNPLIAFKNYLEDEEVQASTLYHNSGDTYYGGFLADKDEDMFYKLFPDEDIYDDEGDYRHGLRQIRLPDDVQDDYWNEKIPYVEEYKAWLFKHMGDLEDYDQQKNSFITMNYVRTLKNQWLIHCTDHVDAIVKTGFKYGLEDYTLISYSSTNAYENDYKYADPDYTYIFAFTPATLPSPSSRVWGNESGLKYGNEAVMFRASGVEIIHGGDMERQVIFMASTARDFVPINYGDDKFYIENKETLGTIYASEDIYEVMDWVEKNFDQYRKVIVQREKN